MLLSWTRSRETTADLDAQGSAPTPVRRGRRTTRRSGVVSRHRADSSWRDEPRHPCRPSRARSLESSTAVVTRTRSTTAPAATPSPPPSTAPRGGPPSVPRSCAANHSVARARPRGGPTSRARSITSSPCACGPTSRTTRRTASPCAPSATRPRARPSGAPGGWGGMRTLTHRGPRAGRGARRFFHGLGVSPRPEFPTSFLPPGGLESGLRGASPGRLSGDGLSGPPVGRASRSTPRGL